MLATLWIFTQNSDNHFCCFNQQQCFIYSTVSFLSKLRAKKVEKLHNSSFYRKYRNRNTGIGFRNRERLFPVLPIIKKKLSRPSDPRFFWHVTVNTHIFVLALQSVNEWPVFNFKKNILTNILRVFNKIVLNRLNWNLKRLHDKMGGGGVNFFHLHSKWCILRHF